RVGFPPALGQLPLARDDLPRQLRRLRAPGRRQPLRQGGRGLDALRRLQPDRAGRIPRSLEQLRLARDDLRGGPGCLRASGRHRQARQGGRALDALRRHVQPDPGGGWPRIGAPGQLPRRIRRMPDRWNDLQWQGQPGHYEVYYVTFTDPVTGVGFWIRYTMVAPLAET